MIKVFSYPQIDDIENCINKWIEKNRINIISLHYNVVVFDNELRHNVIIIYNNEDLNPS